MSPPKLSISIVHHHGLDMLRDCLDSIYTNSPPFAFEVIVVDNASTDGAVAMIESEFPQVALIKNDVRHGFGHNQNTGIEASSGQYLLIYNDDTLLHGDALQALCEFLDQNPQVGLVGPKLLNADGTLQQSCYKFPTPLRYIWENTLLTATFPNSTIFGDYRKWQHDSIREVDFVVGAAMLVRRAVVEQVGLFDELFFMYSEETDWQMRIKKAGWQIKLCPSAVITHLGGKSSEDAKDRQFCEFNSSAKKLMIKHYGSIGSAVQTVSMTFGATLRISIWSIVALAFPNKRVQAEKTVHTWKRLLKWWLGGGPYEGLSS